MSARRRLNDTRSPSPEASVSPTPSPSPPLRQSREVRISTGSSGNSRGLTAKLSTSRTRRPTPVVRRPNSGRLSELLPHDHDEGEGAEVANDDRRHKPNRHHQHRHDDGSASDEEANADHRKDSRRQVSIKTESVANGRGGRARQVRLTSQGCSSRADYDGLPLSWYERMMPECILNMTAPFTGYERELAQHGELDDYAYEILERERVRRNRRIRRRLAIALLAVGAASAFFIYRGRMPSRRPPGVRGAITAMTSRLEDGLNKTIQDTMGK